MTNTAKMIDNMLSDWAAMRAEIQALEKREHPDVTDSLGRRWTWISGDLYEHDGMAWPLPLVNRPYLRGPLRALLDSPSYTWCDVCKANARD